MRKKNSSRDAEINPNNVINGLMQDFLKFKNELSVLLWAQGWRKNTNLLVTTSSDTVGRISVPVFNTVSASLFISLFTAVLKLRATAAPGEQASLH